MNPIGGVRATCPAVAGVAEADTSAAAGRGSRPGCPRDVEDGGRYGTTPHCTTSQGATAPQAGWRCLARTRDSPRDVEDGGRRHKLVGVAWHALGLPRCVGRRRVGGNGHVCRLHTLGRERSVPASGGGSACGLRAFASCVSLSAPSGELCEWLGGSKGRASGPHLHHLRALPAASTACAGHARSRRTVQPAEGLRDCGSVAAVTPRSLRRQRHPLRRADGLQIDVGPLESCQGLRLARGAVAGLLAAV